jgi:heme A synthase
MLELSTFFEALSLVISVFLIAVTVSAWRRRRLKILKYIIGVFALIFAQDVTLILQVFYIIPYAVYDTDLFVLVDLAILALFYAGIVRGN